MEVASSDFFAYFSSSIVHKEDKNMAEKIKTVVHCNYVETDELRNMPIKDLEGIPELSVNAMAKHEIFTVGEALDAWNKLSDFKGVGVIRLRHVKAAIFAQICEMGLLKKCELQDVIV